MDIAEFLKVTDDLMFDSTSKYLDSLQRLVIEGAWEGKSYQNIAAETGRTEGHIRDIAANLWKDISELTGQKVKKSNFRSTIERSYFGNCKSIVHVGNMNFHPDRMEINYLQEKLRQKILNRNPTLEKRKLKNRDVGKIPDLFAFYGRDRELAKLEEWIFEDDCRLIDVYGMSGIGKTALVRQLAAQIGDGFDRTIWVNLRSDRSVLDFIDRDLLPYLSIAKRATKAVDLMPNANWDLEHRISLLMAELSHHRYLIVLDNLQQVFSSGELAGVYGDNYRGYQELFAQFSDPIHQSCILLVGWEEPQNFALLAGENRLVRSLTLDGLSIDAQQQILQDRGMVNGDRLLKIFVDYGGNPLYLTLLARTIEDCFAGNIKDFAQNCQLLLTNDIKLILQRQFDRLSSIEHQVMDTIAASDLALSFPDLLAASQISPADLLAAIQSLKRRGSISRQETALGILFDLPPIIREFICLDKVP